MRPPVPARGDLCIVGALMALVACRPAAGPVEAHTGTAAGLLECDGSSVDADGDGVADTCEATLAERFAPVVIHSSAESAFPTDVDDFLPQTSLELRDDT